MIVNIILFMIGYLAMGLLMVVFMSWFLATDTNNVMAHDDDNFLIGLASVFWPVTIPILILLCAIYLIVVYPGHYLAVLPTALIRRLHNTGESFARPQRRRSKENE